MTAIAGDWAPKRRNKSGEIGTRTATAVARYLTANGWPYAERRTLKGSHDQGDITGTPGICWEVKGGQAAKTASDGQIAAWLDETERERVNARADIGVLVVQRAGIGAANCGRWWAIIPWAQVYHLMVGPNPATPAAPLAPMRWHLFEAVDFLRAAGYGDAP